MYPMNYCYLRSFSLFMVLKFIMLGKSFYRYEKLNLLYCIFKYALKINTNFIEIDKSFFRQSEILISFKQQHTV